MDNIVASNHTVDEKLRLVISSHVKIASEKPYGVALMVNEWRNLKEPKYSEYVALRNLYEKKIKALLAEGMQTKVFKDVDLDIAVAALLGSIRWFYDKFADEEKVLNPIELQRQITVFLFEGILNK